MSRSDTAIPAIYPLLASHQRSEPWARQALITEFQVWADRLNGEFKLDIPEFVISLDRLSVNRYGQFRYGHNGLGLKGEMVVVGGAYEPMQLVPGMLIGLGLLIRHWNAVPQSGTTVLAQLTAGAIGHNALFYVIQIITLVLLSVFVPTAFIPGITGQLYKQFAVAVSVAMVISAISSRANAASRMQRPRSASTSRASSRC